MVIATLGVRRGKIPNLILQGKRYESLNDYGKLTKPIHLVQWKGHSLVGIGYYCFCELDMEILLLLFWNKRDWNTFMWMIYKIK
jgi:hypothetical protein